MSEHVCSDKCSRNAAGRCRVVASERNAEYYERNRRKVLQKAKERTARVNAILAEHERLHGRG